MIRAAQELISFFTGFRECFLVILAHQFLRQLFELMIDLVNLNYLMNFMADYFMF
jgi:hypothetical protein